MKICANKLIYMEEYIPINGISQYLFHSGTSYHNPVMLFLHGGPGAVESLFAYSFQENWEDIYTIVHWDQRGAGKTLTENPDSDSFPNIELLLDDLFQVIHYLKKKYKKEKIILLGHSWGTILGTLYIQKHPEDIEYYIGVGQVINMLENEKVAYNKTKEVIISSKNKRDLKKLNSLGDYPGDKLDFSSKDKLIKFRKLQAKYNLSTKLNFSIFKLAFKSPIFQYSDITSYIKRHSANTKLYSFMETFNLNSLPNSYSIPIYYILGANDWQTPYTIAQSYFNSLTAPYKKLYLIPDAGHMTMFDKPDLVFQALKNIKSLSSFKIKKSS